MVDSTSSPYYTYNNDNLTSTGFSYYTTNVHLTITQADYNHENIESLLEENKKLKEELKKLRELVKREEAKFMEKMKNPRLKGLLDSV